METLWDKLRDPGCNRCELHETAQSVCLIGEGPYPAEVMLIGEAPGFREDKIKKPFSGKAGRILDSILESINLNREEIFITNIVHCRPPENRKPRKNEMDACRYHLLREIENVKPKKIVLLGRSAIYGLFKYDKLNIEQMRGRVYKYNDSRVYVTYHTAAILRRPFLEKVVHKDFLRIFSNSKPKPKLEVSYKDLTVSDALNLNTLNTLSPKAISIDIETPGGTIFYENPIHCISISPKSGVSYYAERPKAWVEYLKPILERSNILKIGHYLKYDLKSLIFEGIMSERSLVENSFFCTMIAFNVIDENYLDKDLEHLADMFTSIGKWKTDQDFTDFDKLRIRNLKDADAAKRLYNVFHKKLEKQGLQIPFKIDMDLMKVLVTAELRGVKIDLDKLNELGCHLEKELTKIRSRIPVENPNSNQKLTSYFNSIGIKSPKYTEISGQSWDKGVLEELRGKLEGRTKQVIENIIEWKKLFGIKTKFINSLPNYADNQGIIHPVFNQVKSLSEETGDEQGTVTGRLSCKNPNLQQTPRDKEETPKEINPRRLFVPTFKNGFIFTADYDQIEIRIAGHDADDEKMIGLLEEKGDIHRLIAAEVLQKPERKITRDERKDMKKVVFGIRYRISARGLSEKMGISLERAERYIRFFFKAFPKQEERIEEIENLVIKDEKIPNMFGRVRRLQGASMESGFGRALVRQGVNFPIQSAAVDIIKIAMFKIWREFLTQNMQSWIFANVHDAIDGNGHPEEKDKVIDIVRKYMENPGLEEYGVKLKVPLIAPVKIGPNWLDVKEV